MDTTLFKTDKVTLPNGETLYIHVSGAGREVLVMLHGMWLDHRCLSPMFPYLEEKFTIIVPDFRGHGQSSYENPVKNVNDFIEDLALVIDHFRLDKVNFFGWCGGSSVALKYASIYPEKVDKMVIVSPPGLEGLPLFKPGKEKGQKNHIESKEDLVNHPSLQRLSKALEEKDRTTLWNIIQTVNFNTKQPDPEIMESLVDQTLMVKNVWDIAWSAYTCNLTDHKKWITDGSGAILKVKSTALLFYGEDDSLIPRFAIDQYFDYLGDNITLKLVKDGGHAVHILYPKEVANDVINYVLGEGK